VSSDWVRRDERAPAGSDPGYAVRLLARAVRPTMERARTSRRGPAGPARRDPPHRPDGHRVHSPGLARGGHLLPGLPGERLLARRREPAARAPAEHAVALPHVDRRPAAPGLRPVVRPRPGLRHPGHRRVRHPRTGPRGVRLRGGERPGRLPVRLRHPDRGRARLRRRPARRRGGPQPLPPLRDLVDPRAGRPLERRLGRDVVPDEQRAAPRRLDLRRRGRIRRSCPGCCGGTRCATGTSTTRSGSRPT
jgi:hypothetical protein